jgi:hypothetical protein
VCAKKSPARSGAKVGFLGKPLAVLVLLSALATLLSALTGLLGLLLAGFLVLLPALLSALAALLILLAALVLLTALVLFVRHLEYSLVLRPTRDNEGEMETFLPLMSSCVAYSLDAPAPPLERGYE